MSETATELTALLWFIEHHHLTMLIAKPPMQRFLCRDGSKWELPIEDIVTLYEVNMKHEQIDKAIAEVHA